MLAGENGSGVGRKPREAGPGGPAGGAHAFAAVRPYAPADREAVLDFRRRTWPESTVREAAYFRWQYEESPLGPAERRLWIARNGGRVRAHAGALPAGLRVEGASLRAGWIMEIFVEPEARGRGYAAALAEAHRRAHEVAVAVEISLAAQRTFLRAGWIDLGTVPVWWRPLDLAAVLRARLPVRGASALGGVLGAGLRAGDALRSRLAPRGPDLREVEAFGPEVDALFEAVSRRDPVVPRRNHAWWRWRFSEHPEAGRYRLYELRSEGRLVGVLVLRLGRRYGLPTAWIVDHLVTPEHLLPAFARALDVSRRLGAAACYTIWLGRDAPTLRRLGFVQRDSGLTFMMRASGLPPALAEILSDPRSWRLTGGDSNLDRPRAPGEGL